MITREVLHLIVVTHIRICCQEAQKDIGEFCVILKEELSGLGLAAEQTHGARRLWLPFFLGFQALRAHKASLCRRPHYLASGGSCTVICFSSLGVELRHVSMENSSPHCSTSQTPANLSPSPGRWTLKGNGGRCSGSRNQLMDAVNYYVNYFNSLDPFRQLFGGLRPWTGKMGSPVEGKGSLSLAQDPLVRFPQGRNRCTDGGWRKR